jgi:hypothetical protein
MGGEGFAGRPPARERRHLCGLGRSHLGGDLILGGRGLQFRQLQLQLIQKPGGALRARAIAVAVELLQMSNQRLIVGALRTCRRDLSACHYQRRLQLFDVVWQGFRAGIHGSDRIIKSAI